MRSTLLPPGRIETTRWPSAVRLGLILLPFLAVALASAYYEIFSHFVGDDEGYLMISVRGFLDGNALYDAVFTQYGPLYYLYQWVLRGALKIPLTHDATRLLCLGHWLGASLLLAWASRQLLRSNAAAVFVFMQAVLHLATISNEPGHPQEIVALLLALGVLWSTHPTRRPLPLERLALVAASCALIKVNVGAFLAFALFWAARCHTADRFNHRVYTGLAAAAFCLLPFWLMRQHVAADWCRNYAVISAGTLLATTLISARFAATIKLSWSRYGRIALAFALPALACLTTLALQGTSLEGAYDGLIRTPLKMPSVALQPILLPSSVLWNAVLALAVAFALVARPEAHGLRRAILLLKFAYGCLGCLCLTRDPFSQLGFLLPWTWLVLVPTAPSSDARETFPRTFLGLSAAWQGLQAYPIAGTQVSLATFPLVLVYTVCLHDALTALCRSTLVARTLAQITPNSNTPARALGWVALLYLFAMVWCQPHLARRSYAELQPLNLSGTERIRLGQEAVDLYQNLTQYLTAECDTFVTYPGFNSLYFWTGKRPPTLLNCTGWGQLSAAQQDRILDGLVQAKRPLLVVHEFVARGWKDGAPPPIATLVHFVQGQCREVHRIGPYIFYRPLPRPARLLPGPSD